MRERHTSGTWTARERRHEVGSASSRRKNTTRSWLPAMLTHKCQRKPMTCAGSERRGSRAPRWRAGAKRGSPGTLAMLHAAPYAAAERVHRGGGISATWAVRAASARRDAMRPPSATSLCYRKHEAQATSAASFTQEKAPTAVGVDRGGRDPSPAAGRLRSSRAPIRGDGESTAALLNRARGDDRVAGCRWKGGKVDGSIRRLGSAEALLAQPRNGVLFPPAVCPGGQLGVRERKRMAPGRHQSAAVAPGLPPHASQDGVRWTDRFEGGPCAARRAFHGRCGCMRVKRRWPPTGAWSA